MPVGLLLKRDKPEALALARELCAALAGRGEETLVVGAPPSLAGELSPARLVDEDALAGVRLLVVLGGDGTLLHGADLVADGGVPILGINLGNLGFLTSCPPEQGRATLEQALDGRLPLERRMRLRIELRRGGGGGARITRFGCNDAVISQRALARLIEFDAFLDGAPITTYRADGLIIATPTGSTAYSLAAGGPILTPSVEAMVLTPICPHMLTNRPVVVPASSRVTVRFDDAAQHVRLTVDGQWGADLERGDEVEVHAANRPLLLHRPADTRYFEILRAKLHWGERMPRDDRGPRRSPRDPVLTPPAPAAPPSGPADGGARPDAKQPGGDEGSHAGAPPRATPPAPRR
jgi:NAD+ kinase